MKLRIAVFVVAALGVLGVSLHAATEHVASECFLCALCPFC